MASKIPVIPGLFIPQTIFVVNNQPIIMGVLKKGDMALTMTTSIDAKSYKLTDIQVLNQHLKLVKSEDKEIMVGIILSNMTVENAQKTVNRELIFK
jgi:hypothetical protein